MTGADYADVAVRAVLLALFIAAFTEVIKRPLKAYLERSGRIRKGSRKRELWDWSVRTCAICSGASMGQNMDLWPEWVGGHWPLMLGAVAGFLSPGVYEIVVRIGKRLPATADAIVRARAGAPEAGPDDVSVTDTGTVESSDG